MKKNWMMATAVALVLSNSGAWAQKLPAYESTGTVDLVIDGKESTYHTTSNTVPNEPGRLVHTARWKTFPPMMMGGVNMAPPGVFVSLTSRPTIQPGSELPSLKITFSLDPEKFTLLESAPTEVIYVVQEGPMAGEYKQASGSILIDSVTPEADTLKIAGRASGTLSSKKGGKKGSGPTLNYQTSFVVQAHSH